MWKEQVLRQEFRNVSCLVTQLEETDSTTDCERSQRCTETQLILRCSAYYQLTISNQATMWTSDSRGVSGWENFGYRVKHVLRKMANLSM